MIGQVLPFKENSTRHYVAYRLIDDFWIEIDNQTAYSVTLSQSYNVIMLFYRHHTSTIPVTFGLKANKYGIYTPTAFKKPKRK